MAAAAEPALASEFPFQQDMNTGNAVRFIAVLSSGLFSSFLETDRPWLGTGSHWQRPAQQLRHNLRWTELH